MSKFINAILTLFLGSVFVSLVADATTGRTSGQDTMSLGPLKINIDYNQTLYKEELKISKSHLTYTTEMFGYKAQLMKVKQKEYLTKCGTIALERPEAWDDIDCKPLITLLHETQDQAAVNQFEATDLQVGHCKQSSFTAKVKSLPFPPLGEIPAHGQQLVLYPLKQSVTTSKISAILEQLEVKDVGFVPRAEEIGFYFELNPDLNDPNHPVMCNGYFVGMKNETDGYMLYSEDPIPGYILPFGNFIEVALDGGALMSINNMSCRATDLSTDKEFKVELSLLTRKEFPYLRLNHKMWVEPDETKMINYTAQITQETNSLLPSQDSYLTHIVIYSYSSLLQGLNFHLDQVVLSNSHSKFRELMHLVVPHYGSVNVTATWADGVLAKSASLGWYPLGLESAAKNIFPDMVTLRFLDQEDKFELMISVNKTMINEAIAERYYKKNLREAYVVLDQVLKVMKDEL